MKSSILAVPKSQVAASGNSNRSLNGRKKMHMTVPTKETRSKQGPTEETSVQAPKKSVAESRAADSSVIRAKVLAQKEPRGPKLDNFVSPSQDV